MEWEIYPAGADTTAHSVAGALRVLRGVRSPQLYNARDVFVYLPPSHGADGRRYPVLYMQDGQNLFDRATSFGDEWGVDEAMEAAAREGLEAIVVGIANTGEARCDEYSPFVDVEAGGGCGDDYLRFIRETIKPLVDGAFSTMPGREHTALMGSSMGGLISLYGFFHEPETFGMAGVMSPSLWFAGEAIFPCLEEAAFSPGRLYLDVGTAEGEQTLAHARRMKDLLARKGYEAGSTLAYLEDEGAGHTETAWGERFSKALRFLIG